MLAPSHEGWDGHSQDGLRRLAFLLALVPILLLGGCAKSPDTGATSLGTQLNVTVTTFGPINPSLYYYVVFNTDQNNASGPVPVIAPPWGNGFVAGTATSYMSFHGNQGQDGYQFYTFQPNTSLQTSIQAGAPTQDTPVTAGSNTLQFRIPLAYLATAAVPVNEIQNIQINVVTTNYVPVNPQDTTPKEFDALGDPTAGHLNSYITLPTDTATTYMNPTSGSPDYEPTGDVQVTNGSGGYTPVSDQSDATAASLDITEYSIQVLH